MSRVGYPLNSLRWFIKVWNVTPISPLVPIAITLNKSAIWDLFNSVYGMNETFVNELVRVSHSLQSAIFFEKALNNINRDKSFLS